MGAHGSPRCAESYPQRQQKHQQVLGIPATLTGAARADGALLEASVPLCHRRPPGPTPVEREVSWQKPRV